MLKVERNLMTKAAMLFVLVFVIGTVSLFAGDYSPGSTNQFLANYFADGLSVGESKTVTVHANKMLNPTAIYISYGMKYKFTVASPEWNNGSRETTAAGYDSSSLRRHPDAKLMELVADLTLDNAGLSYTGKYVRIGMGKSSWTATGSGWLSPFANDCDDIYLHCYADNSRIVELTIKRVE
jgi:hypothetical protein